MLRRSLVALLATALLLSLSGIAVAAQPSPPLPRPAIPRGPVSIYPLDNYGPRATDNVVLRWNEQALAAIRATRPGPTVVARALAIVQTCVYDAWAAYDATAVGTRLGGSLRRPAEERTEAFKSKAVSYAAYRALLDLFPARRADFEGFMVALGYDPADASTDTTTPQGIGNVACQAVLDYRHADGSNQLGGYADTSGYAPVNAWDNVVDPLRWQPLRVPDGAGNFTIQRFSTPHWGGVAPFALTSPRQFPPPGPTIRTLDAYRLAVDRMVRETANLNDERKVIAEYWSDGPASELPPGHWNIFAQAVSRKRGQTLDQDVRMFFALDNAMLDASIAAWDAKVRWDFVRPITAIRTQFLGGRPIRAWRGPYQGIGIIPGENWLPYQPATFPTPPFADYVSGHSTFSAAGAEVLRTFTGSDSMAVSVTVPAGAGRVEPGLVPAAAVRLSWPTFTFAADQAGMSRRWGGIHFADADLHARGMGRSIGANAYRRAQSYINGTG